MSAPLADSFIERHREQILAGLYEFVRFPSVSTDPAHGSDMAACAQWLAAEFSRIGLRGEVRATRGHPAVVAASPFRSERPTVLVYGHYDVQPVDPEALWTHPPFAPHRDGDRLYARGASDNKGPLWAHIKAAEAWMEQTGEVPVNLVFLVEGEEEVGSASLPEVVRELGRDRSFRCVVVSDTLMAGRDRPSLTHGLRGLAYFEVRLRGPNRDLHSGVYGGSVPNPATILCQLLSTCLDAETGRIAIPGFYDDVRAVSPEERAAAAALPFDEVGYRLELGLRGLVGEAGYSTLERRWARPALDVNGLFGGFQGAGAKTIIPGEAGAKVSFRLVPDQDPRRVDQLFRAYLAAMCSPYVDLEITTIQAGRPYYLPVGHPLIQLALAAIRDGFGVEPAVTREGGSVPIVQAFKEILAAETLLIALGLSDDNWHAPDEKFELSNLWRGIRTMVSLYGRLAS